MNKMVFLLGLFYLIFAPIIDLAGYTDRIFIIGSLWNLLFGDKERDIVFGLILLFIGWLWPSRED